MRTLGMNLALASGWSGGPVDGETRAVRLKEFLASDPPGGARARPERELTTLRTKT